MSGGENDLCLWLLSRAVPTRTGGQREPMSCKPRAGATMCLFSSKLSWWHRLLAVSCARDLVHETPRHQETLAKEHFFKKNIRRYFFSIKPKDGNKLFFQTGNLFSVISGPRPLSKAFPFKVEKEDSLRFHNKLWERCLNSTGGKAEMGGGLDQ